MVTGKDVKKKPKKDESSKGVVSGKKVKKVQSPEKLTWSEICDRGPTYLKGSYSLPEAHEYQSRRDEYQARHGLPEMYEWSFDDIVFGPPIMFESMAYPETLVWDKFVFRIKDRYCVHTQLDYGVFTSMDAYRKIFTDMDKRMEMDSKKGPDYCEFQASLSNLQRDQWSVPYILSDSKKAAIEKLLLKGITLKPAAVQGILLDPASVLLRTGKYPNVKDLFPGKLKYRKYLMGEKPLPNFDTHVALFDSSEISSMYYLERRSITRPNKTGKDARRKASRTSEIAQAFMARIEAKKSLEEANGGQGNGHANGKDHMNGDGSSDETDEDSSDESSDDPTGDPSDENRASSEEGTEKDSEDKSASDQPQTDSPERRVRKVGVVERPKFD